MAMPPMSLKEDLETLWESFKLPEETEPSNPGRTLVPFETDFRWMSNTTVNHERVGFLRGDSHLLKTFRDWKPLVIPHQLHIPASIVFDPQSQQNITNGTMIQSEAVRQRYPDAEHAARFIHIGLKREEAMAAVRVEKLLTTNPDLTVNYAFFFPHSVRPNIYCVMLFVFIHDDSYLGMTDLLNQMPTVGTRIRLLVPDLASKTCSDIHHSYFSGEVIHNHWNMFFRPTKDVDPLKIFLAMRGINMPPFPTGMTNRYDVKISMLGDQASGSPLMRQLRAINDIVISRHRNVGPKITRIFLNADTSVPTDTAFLSQFSPEACYQFVYTIKKWDLNERETIVAAQTMITETSIVTFSGVDDLRNCRLLTAIAMGHAFAGRRVLYVANSIRRAEWAVQNGLAYGGTNHFRAQNLGGIRFVGTAYDASDCDNYCNVPSEDCIPDVVPPRRILTPCQSLDNEAVDEQWSLPFKNMEAEEARGQGEVGYHTRLIALAKRAAADPVSPIHGPGRIFLATAEKLKTWCGSDKIRKMQRELLFRNEKVIRDYMFMHETNIIMTSYDLAGHPALDHFDVDVVIMHDRGRTPISTAAIPFGAKCTRYVKLIVIGGNRTDREPYMVSKNQNPCLDFVRHSLLKKIIFDSILFPPSRKYCETYDLAASDGIWAAIKGKLKKPKKKMADEDLVDAGIASMILTRIAQAGSAWGHEVEP